MKYNCVIMPKEILKHTCQYLENDVKDWIFKKALQGSNNDYWDILFYIFIFFNCRDILYFSIVETLTVLILICSFIFSLFVS